ncbi:IS5 family transposase [Bradyrhizobium sp. USDA 4524]|nr:MULTISPECIES: IS5 family transposase [unclassified Bradyrhizobium]MCP1839179.1 IS5 family transposase [Bradyrhizobium sp. USDA 4538]MCP1899744.1 IS5 family transposase [Bradyrhizobium sp. USDA 4537]MCP1986146.1 IS5 family transposase [Bradyrhizobium sp. USDA 4539]
MAERQIGQLSFTDGLMNDAARANAPLQRVSELVDWNAIEALLSGLRSGSMGAPAYPSLALFKALLLQQWYGLSDPGLEEALVDRLSFRRFLGLSLSEPVPDHSTLWRFREQLAKSGLAERAFALITAQIEKSGFVLKRGTLIDASLIRSAVNPPEPPDPDLPPDADGRPASKLVKSAHDPDAAWTKKDGKYAFGYKMHVAMDQGSRIIRRLAFTPANVNDTVPADGLICGDEATVYADKAYDTIARRVRLKEMDIRDGIMRRHNRWLRLGPWAVRRNAVISHRRAPIEPLFALLKRVYGLARARYRGLMRNAAAFQLAATAINLQRWARTPPQIA